MRYFFASFNAVPKRTCEDRVYLELQNVIGAAGAPMEIHSFAEADGEVYRLNFLGVEPPRLDLGDAQMLSPLLLRYFVRYCTDGDTYLFGLCFLTGTCYRFEPKLSLRYEKDNPHTRGG